MNLIVVGAGPAGAALAYLAARAGIDVTLLEREAEFDRVFRGEGLMPSGVDALHEMGLAELLNELPTRILESWDIYVGRKSIFSVPEPVDELGDKAVRIIPQAQFLERVVDIGELQKGLVDLGQIHNEYKQISRTDRAVQCHRTTRQDNQYNADPTGYLNHADWYERQGAGPQHIIMQPTAARFDLAGLLALLDKRLDDADAR